jgi:hypothetical protein
MPLLSPTEPHRRPYGYRCAACNHLWDAPGAPCGTREEVFAILDAAKEAYCPECGVVGPATLNPWMYAERLREKKDLAEDGAADGAAPEPAAAGEQAR